jgi:hypothetical protein
MVPFAHGTAGEVRADRMRQVFRDAEERRGCFAGAEYVE